MSTPQLMTLPAQEFATRAEMLEVGLGFKKKWVIILNDEAVDNKMTVHYFDGRNLTALFGDAGAGRGVPPGGATGWVLAKRSGSDFDTEWIDPNAEPPDVLAINDDDTLLVNDTEELQLI